MSYIGIDVGSHSCRAVLVTPADHTSKNAIITSASRPIQVSTIRVSPTECWYEQNGEQIWRAVCECVRELMSEQVSEQILGIGFDATCSLVLLKEDGSPNIMNSNQNTNIIMWMDHRAGQQTQRINDTQHDVLKYVGGQMSIEMEPPKILWLSENQPKVFKSTGYFMDLADFLTFRATGCDNRSQCTLVCKWGYTGEPNDVSFWRCIGLPTIADRPSLVGFDRVQQPGTLIKEGLNQRAAAELGLPLGTPVALGLIDAHAGALYLLAAACKHLHHSSIIETATECLSIIAGTSTCHMAVASKPFFVNGVWGPYKNAVLPNSYLNEAGQSAVGSCLDAVIKHMFRCTIDEVESKHTLLISHLQDFQNQHGVQILADHCRNMHVYPDYHGNRSPWSDPNMTAGVLGLTMDNLTMHDNDDVHAKAIYYLCHVYAFAYSSRVIMETLQDSGHKFECVALCGGMQKNVFYVQAHADVLGLPVFTADCSEPVAVGAAMLATGFDQLSPTRLAHRMVPFEPDVSLRKFHDVKYVVFKKLAELIREAKDLMIQD